MFATQIRDYITTTLESNIIDRMMELINPLNDFLQAGTGTPYWPVLLDLTGLNLSGLPPAPAWRGAKPLEDIKSDESEITIPEEGELIWVLEKSIRSRAAVVTKCKEADTQITPGARILGLNGLTVDELTVQEVRKLLQCCSRPMKIRLIRGDRELFKKKRIALTHVEFGTGPLGLKLLPRPLAEQGAVVAGFLKLPEGKIGAGEKSGKVVIGQLVLRVNDVDVLNLPFKQVIEKIKEASRPLTMRFADNSDGVIKLNVWPPDLELVRQKDHVCIQSLRPRELPLVLEGKLPPIGATLFSVNGYIVKNNELDQLHERLDKRLMKSNEKWTFVFENYDAVVIPPGPYGMKFGRNKLNTIILRSFVPCPNVAEKNGLLYPGLAILRICNEILAPDVTIDSVQGMIKNAVPPYSISVRDLVVFEELKQLA